MAAAGGFARESAYEPSLSRDVIHKGGTSPARGWLSLRGYDGVMRVVAESPPRQPIGVVRMPRSAIEQVGISEQECKPSHRIAGRGDSTTLGWSDRC